MTFSEKGTDFHPQTHIQKFEILEISLCTARWGQINYKKKVHPKFLQNLLVHIPIDMFFSKKKNSAIESATVNFF